MSERIYLVTGAAGFLGGTICRKLVERGDKVRAFVLPNDPAMKFVPREAEIVEGDLTNKASLEKFFAVDGDTETIVLHIASIVSVNPEYNQKVMDVNVGGTQNIIDLCLEHPECKKLVYCSSTGAIPEQPKGIKISDESGCRPIKMFLPIWAANLMGKAMETMGKIRGTKPLMTTFSVYNLARNNAFDSSKAKKELGYRTRSYRETIHDEIEWLKAAGKIA